LGIRGCQKDHYHFSVAINGIFWYDPALYPTVYRLLRSPLFDMEDAEAKAMMRRCFTEESEGLHRSYRTHREAVDSYKVYLEKVGYAWQRNRDMALMNTNSIETYVQVQRRAFSKLHAHNLRQSAE